MKLVFRNYTGAQRAKSLSRKQVARLVRGIIRLSKMLIGFFENVLMTVLEKVYFAKLVSREYISIGPKSSQRFQSRLVKKKCSFAVCFRMSMSSF